MNILIGILLLGFIIFFHELGHFIAARLCGVTVESFSIGMGPFYIHKKIRGVDLRLSLFPFGGYCGMKGEKDFLNAVEAGLDKITADKDSFYGTNPFRRALIGFAGPLFNLIFAFIAYTIIAMAGFKYYAPSAVIEIPQEEGFESPAGIAGIQSGDRITKINGEIINDFYDIAREVSIHPDEDLIIEVERADETLRFTVHTKLNKDTGTGILGVRSGSEFEEREISRLPLHKALVTGFKNTGKNLGIAVKSLSVLFKGINLLNAVSGPAQMSSLLGENLTEGFSDGVRTGVVTTLDFLALISVSLFIMNLLPIPILDGGIVLFALIEGIFKKQVPPRIQSKIQIAGVVIIGFLFMLAISSDIKYFITKFGVIKK